MKMKKKSQKKMIKQKTNRSPNTKQQSQEKNEHKDTANQHEKIELPEEYELNRENTLVSQAGLITAVFSFSTTALFTVWQIGLDELEKIPDAVIHVVMGVISIFLLLSMGSAVLALSKIINTSKTKDITIEYIKDNNNKMVCLIQKSIKLFLTALFVVFISAILIGAYYYGFYFVAIIQWFFDPH